MRFSLDFVSGLSGFQMLCTVQFLILENMLELKYSLFQVHRRSLSPVELYDENWNGTPGENDICPQSTVTLDYTNIKFATNDSDFNKNNDK
jgi:hypothetical protein